MIANNKKKHWLYMFPQNLVGALIPYTTPHFVWEYPRISLYHLVSLKIYLSFQRRWTKMILKCQRMPPVLLTYYLFSKIDLILYSDLLPWVDCVTQIVRLNVAQTLFLTYTSRKMLKFIFNFKRELSFFS